MLGEIGLEALTEWAVFEQLEPQQPERGDLNLAATLHFLDSRFMAMADVMVALKTGKEPRKRTQREVKDYLTRFGDDIPTPTRKQTWQEQWAILTAYAKAVSAKPQPKARPKRPTRPSAPQRRALPDRRRDR